MKKIILLLLGAGSMLDSNAQKNSILLLGNVGGSTYSAEDTTSTSAKGRSLAVSPALGYQLSDHWTLGILADVSIRSDKRNSTTNPTYNSKTVNIKYGGGVFARHTLAITDLLFLATQADIIYSTGEDYLNGKKDLSPNVKVLSARITPAIGLKIKNGYALNFGFGSINYNYTTNSTNASTNKGLSFSAGRSFSFALTKNFIRRKIQTKPAAQG